MLFFLAGIVLLIAGYFTYGKLVEKIVGPDDRIPPAISEADGVDYVRGVGADGKPRFEASLTIRK